MWACCLFIQVYVLNPKQDSHGLGYDPFKHAPEFRGTYFVEMANFFVNLNLTDSHCVFLLFYPKFRKEKITDVGDQGDIASEAFSSGW